MYTALLFALFRYTVKNSLTALYAFDLNVEEVCIKVKILHNCENSNDHPCYIGSL